YNCESALERKSTGKSRLKIEQADPLGSNRDSHHRRDHFSHLCYPDLSLLASEVAFSRHSILGHDSIHWLHACSATNQEHFVRRRVVVDGQGDSGVLSQSLELRCLCRRAHDKFPPVPVKPNGNDPW